MSWCWLLHYWWLSVPRNVDRYLLKNQTLDKDAKIGSSHTFLTLVQPHWPQVDVKAKAKFAAQMPDNSTCDSYKLWYFKITFRSQKEYKARYQLSHPSVSSPCSFPYFYIHLAQNHKEYCRWPCLYILVFTYFFLYINIYMYKRLFCYLYMIKLNQAPVKAIHKCPQGKRQESPLQ